MIVEKILNSLPTLNDAVVTSLPSYYPNSMKFSGDGNKVAVIMRTLDRPLLLRRGLESVLRQTHKNWHLYLVNDGGDKLKLEQFLAGYNDVLDGRLTLIHHSESLGRWVAANSGLKMAVGDFVILHDDDDIWHTEFLQKTVKFLNRADSKSFVGVVTNSEIIKEEIQGDTLIEIRRKPWSRFSKNIAFADMLWDNTIPPIAFLIRKAAADSIGLFNDNLPVSGDWEYNIRLLQRGDIGVIDEVLAFYCLRTQHKGSYGNSTNPATGLHTKYNTFYTNALIRETLNAYPQQLGILRLIALKNDKIDRIEENLEKLRKDIKYSGFFGRLSLIWKQLKKKLRRHTHHGG